MKDTLDTLYDFKNRVDYFNIYLWKTHWTHWLTLYFQLSKSAVTKVSNPICAFINTFNFER